MTIISSFRRAAPLLIFFFALFVRALYLWQQQANPLNAYPLGDSVTYMREAERILNGDWIGTRVFTFGGSAFYPYFLALIFSIAGKSLLTVQIIQYIMGAFTCTLIYLTGERLFGRSTGVAVGLISAVFPPFLFHEGLILTGGPGILFLSVALYLLISDKKGSCLFLAGLSLGLAVLCRPNALLLAPLFFGWLITGVSKKRVTASLFFMAGVSAVILPVTVRNYVVGKDFVLISSSGGVNFFIGNNPLSRGIFSIPPETGISNDSRMYITSESRARSVTGLPLKPSGVSRFWFKKGTDFILSEPGRAFSLLIKKILLFLNAREITNLYKFNFFSEYSLILPLSVPLYGVTVIFGITGAMFMLFTGARQERLLSLSFFVYSLSVIIFFVSSRLRLPASLFLILSSGFTFRQLLSRRSIRFTAITILLAIPLSFLTFREVGADLEEVTNSNFHTYTQLANKNKKSKNYNDAIHFFNLAVSERPDNIMLLADAGDMALKVNSISLAKQYYRKILVITKNFPPEPVSRGPFNWSNPAQMSVYRAMYQLGILYYNELDFEKARLFLAAATNRFFPGLEAQIYLSRTYMALDKREHAISVLTDYMKKYPNPIIREELFTLQNYRESVKKQQTGRR